MSGGPCPPPPFLPYVGMPPTPSVAELCSPRIWNSKGGIARGIPMFVRILKGISHEKKKLTNTQLSSARVFIESALVVCGLFSVF